MLTQYQTPDPTIDLRTPESRKALGKMVTRLFALWELNAADQLNLLGLSHTSHAMLTKYRKGTAIPNSRDMLDRVGWLLSIHKALRLLFPYNREFRSRWISKRNRLLDNMRPLDLMKEKGLIGIATVSRHLDSLRGQ